MILSGVFTRKRDFIILFGGKSSERLVSVATAQNISEALPEAIGWFWSETGVIYEVARDEILFHTNAFNDNFIPKTKPIAPNLKMALNFQDIRNSVFILATHGGDGENGVVQKWLEVRKLQFTGSGSTSSSLCMSKDVAKNLMKTHGFCTADFELISKKNLSKAVLVLEYMLLKYNNVFLKPTTEGSSIGAMIVGIENKKQAISLIEEFSEKDFLLEEYLQGTEITVSVYDDYNKKSIALMPIEIKSRKKNIFPDYQAKYFGIGIEEIIPARISQNLAMSAKKIAIAAHNLLGCYGYSRTDMIIQAGDIFYLETNSLPGLTKSSLMPKALEYEGITMKEFVTQQIGLSRARS